MNHAKPEDACFHLRNGEFEKAKKIFSAHLDTNPDCIEWVEGYYVASFWDNKLDHILALREGRERGKALFNYLRTFETEISNRNFPRLQAYQDCVQCVLEETVRNLEIAFRIEGWNGFDSETINGLASCHLRLGNFQKAMEILQFTGSEKFQNAESVFLKADCCIGLGKVSEGISLYIEGFLDDPAKLPVASLHWKPIQEAFQKAKTMHGYEFALSLVPVILLREGNLEANLHLEPREFQKYFQIATRLFSGIQRHTSNSYERTLLRVYFIAEILLQSTAKKQFPEESNALSSMLLDLKKEISGLLPG